MRWSLPSSTTKAWAKRTTLKQSMAPSLKRGFKLPACADGSMLRSSPYDQCAGDNVLTRYTCCTDAACLARIARMGQMQLYCILYDIPAQHVVTIVGHMYVSVVS